MPQEEELNQAISLIHSGKKSEAVPILKSILKINRDDELAWLWLAFCVETKDDKIYCFREALRINPNNTQTRDSLDQLTYYSNPQKPILNQNTSQTAKKSTSSWKCLTIVLVIFAFCMIIFIWRIETEANNIPTPTITPNYLQTQILDSIVAATLAKLHPPSTPTPDQRSDFEKCEQSGYGVRYVISGNSNIQVSLTWQNDTGGTNQGDYEVPFCETFTNFHSGDFLYISAQITYPTDEAGSIDCTIYDGNTIVAQATANGFPSIADCSGLAN